MQNISTIPEFAAFLRENFDLTQEEENLTQKYFEKQDIKKNEILLNIG